MINYFQDFSIVMSILYCPSVITLIYNTKMTIPDFWRKIKKLNIYNLDGNQIENPDELADFCIYSAKILDELYNALNNNSDHKTIEEKIK